MVGQGVEGRNGIHVLVDYRGLSGGSKQVDESDRLREEIVQFIYQAFAL